MKRIMEITEEEGQGAPGEEAKELINWLDNAPFLMGELTENDRHCRERIISLILKTTLDK